MIATLVIVIFLCVMGFVGLVAAMSQNMPVTSEALHGRHRTTGTPLHGSPNQITHFSPGGASSFDPGEDDTTAIANYPGAIIPVTGRPRLMMTHNAFSSPAHLGAGYSPHMAVATQQQMLAMMKAQMPRAQLGSLAPHEKTNLRSEGIRVGEIIAWRAWRVHFDTLRSATADSVWDADEPMRGDPATGYGVHAYKNPHGPMMDGYADAQRNAWVIGEVALWGDIIEHERGYRAEFGRVQSLVTWSRDVSQSERAIIGHRYLAHLKCELKPHEDEA